jgi:SAM-dependent methyltransferase
LHRSAPSASEQLRSQSLTADTGAHRWELQRRVESEHFWFLGFRKFVEPVLAATVRGLDNPRILDCGCGTGVNLSPLSRFGRVIGLELSPSAVAIARQTNRSVVQADAVRLPLRSNSFDVVTLFDVLPCIPADAAAVVEAARVLKPGGTLVLTAAAFQLLRGDHAEIWAELHRYNPSGLRGIVQDAGLKPVTLRFLFASTFPLFVAVRLWQRMSRPFRRRPTDIDMRLPPPALNSLLRAVVSAEAALARRVPMPIGSSLLVMARKPK